MDVRALICAAANGETECLKALLVAEANTEAKQVNECTALMFAAGNGKAECLKSIVRSCSKYRGKR